MRIAQVAPLYEPVPPDLYGGTERVVGYLVDELARRGHQVTLFASGDSSANAEHLVAPTRRALRLDGETTDPVALHISEVGMVFERALDFDVIHSHVDYLAFTAAQLAHTPTIHTLHGRLDLPHLRPVFRQFRNLAFVSISDAQRAPLADDNVNWVATVRHGLPVDEYKYSPRGGDYLVYLGRISPEKGPDRAVAVAQEAGIPLKIAAKVDDADRAYFERDIRPLLDDPLIEFIGEVDLGRKMELLGGARALIFPIDWPEPFGLVMIEAMACGTPVVARPRGAVPEVVVHEKTGFLADTIEELAAAVKRVDRLDRLACRRHVEACFSVTRMVDEYERLYVHLAAGRGRTPRIVDLRVSSPLTDGSSPVTRRRSLRY
jgi:glycosyltransferase involved in cell wall biosynthesis